MLPPDLAMGNDMSYIEVRTTACHAGMDGECAWGECPQIEDDEPRSSGRHCPLDRIAVEPWGGKSTMTKEADNGSD